MGDLLTNFLSGPVPVEAYLGLSLLMFFAGIYGFLSRKSLLMILISIELMLNAADINFVVFNRYFYSGHLEGSTLHFSPLPLQLAKQQLP